LIHVKRELSGVNRELHLSPRGRIVVYETDS
jgi:hypothetical protein